MEVLLNIGKQHGVLPCPKPAGKGSKSNMPATAAAWGEVPMMNVPLPSEVPFWEGLCDSQARGVSRVP